MDTKKTPEENKGMYTVATKSMLAKLMATENIRVEHNGKFTTASFDLKNRVLRCPMWKDMSGDLYDLLMGHEISHALRTPLQGWHDSLVYQGGNKKASKKEQQAFKHFLNVVEDARIEKLLKRQYPGIRRPMSNAYKQLMAKDFFGLSAISDYNNLYLIDKLNLSAKVGVLLNIRFTAAEKPFEKEMQELETWDDTVVLAKKIYTYSKEEQQEGEKKKEELKRQLDEEAEKEREEEEAEWGDDDEDGGEYGEDGDEDGEDEDGDSEDGGGDSEDGDGEDEKDGKGSDSEGDDAKDDKEKKADDATVEKGKGKGNGSTAKKESKDAKNVSDTDGVGDGSASGDFVPSAKTDEEFRKKEENLVEIDDVESVYVKIPTPNLKDCVSPASIVNRELSKYYSNYRVEGMKALNAFKKKNEDYIMLLAKEFEMKKAARSYALAKTSDSGDININKLANYRLEDNIFKRLMIVNKGKSHGLVLILDKSGSMAQHMEAAIEQILIMALFCRKVNIPFAAYSFTTTGGRAHEFDFGTRAFGRATLAPFSKNAGEIVMKDFDFRELLNSKMQAAEFNQAMMNQLQVAQSLAGSGHNGRPDHEDMGSTPLNEALVVLRDVLRNFKMMHRLDIVNAVIVHDGDADSTRCMYRGAGHAESRDHFEPERQRVTIRDAKEELDIPLNRDYNGLTIGLLKWIQMTTNCGVFGFYISGSITKEVKHSLFKMYRNKLGVALGSTSRYNISTDEALLADKLAKEVLEEKFVESWSEGYTRFFFIPGAGQLKTESGELINTGKTWTPSRLLSAFKKVNRRKSVSRVLVSRFIELMAT